MKVLLIMPVYSHIHERTRATIRALGLEAKCVYGSTDLPLVRSMLFSEAVRSDAERVVCLDSDVVPTPDQLGHLIASDKVTDTCAVSAVYASRDQSVWAFNGAEGEPDADGWLKVREAGLGCAVISRRSLANLAGKLGAPLQSFGVDWWPFCIPFITGMTYVPEDYSLWRRLANSGTSLLVNTQCVVGHMGEVEIRAPASAPC